MGHSRPKYNSAVSTFCWALANDQPFTVNYHTAESAFFYAGFRGAQRVVQKRITYTT